MNTGGNGYISGAIPHSGFPEGAQGHATAMNN